MLTVSAITMGLAEFKVQLDDSDEDEKLDALAEIWELASDEDVPKSAFLQAGCVHSLIRECSHGRSEIRREALDTLAAVSTGFEASLKEILPHLPMLVQLLASQQEFVAESSVACLIALFALEESHAPLRPFIPDLRHLVISPDARTADKAGQFLLKWFQHYPEDQDDGDKTLLKRVLPAGATAALAPVEEHPLVGRVAALERLVAQQQSQLAELQETVAKLLLRK